MLDGWKQKAETEERNSHRLSNVVKEERAAHRKDKGRLVSGSKRKLIGLKRTMRSNKVTATELRRTVTTMESGQKVKEFNSQLTEAQKQSQKATDDSRRLQRRPGEQLRRPSSRPLQDTFPPSDPIGEMTKNLKLIVDKVEKMRIAAFLIPLCAEHTFRTYGHHFISTDATNYTARYKATLKACLRSTIADILPPNVLFHTALH
ncbi:MAG: hypothetical protein Q9161_008594 [Pseudevernia consocians]